MQGYAVVSTDAGHQGTLASGFGYDAQARIDHAYNAYDKTALVAKAIVAAYYGKAPDKSYFVGCSGGGRQGMMFTQRFPRYFNGVIAGAPAMRVATGASSAAAWQTIAFNSAAPEVNGQRLLSQAFSDADLALVAGKTLEACDANDGIADGIIHNTAACRFDAAVLQCEGAKTDNCLTAAQVAALKKAFSAPVNARGERLYSSWPYDAGITGADWRAWKLGTATTPQPNSRFVALIEDALKHEFFTPPDPAFSLVNYNFDTDPARQVEYGKLYDTWRNAVLAEFQDAGGKLILWNGMSDPIFSANETIEYYERLVKANGAQRAASFARLYLVPGMNHCGGGPATDNYDAFTRLIDWVENGNPPGRIIASGATFPGRTRPLCPYPSYARYSGAGNPEAAASFVCRQPD
jgi:feruloyl esterase